MLWCQPSDSAGKAPGSRHSARRSSPTATGECAHAVRDRGRNARDDRASSLERRRPGSEGLENRTAPRSRAAPSPDPGRRGDDGVRVNSRTMSQISLTNFSVFPAIPSIRGRKPLMSRCSLHGDILGASIGSVGFSRPRLWSNFSTGGERTVPFPSPCIPSPSLHSPHVHETALLFFSYS